MKNYSNLTRRSRLLLLMLFALLAGGVSPAWADEVTEQFTTNDWPDGWSMSASATSSDYYIEYDASNDYSYPSGRRGVYGQVSSGTTKYIITPVVNGNGSFKFKRRNSSNGSVYVYTIDSNGDLSTSAITSNTSKPTSFTTVSFSNVSNKRLAIVLNGRMDDFKYTPGTESPVEGPKLAVKDGTTTIFSPYAFDFGNVIPGTTHQFTLSNDGTASLGVSVSETGSFGATLSSSTIAAGGEVTLTITMPNATGSSTITITPAEGSGIDNFVINASASVAATFAIDATSYNFGMVAKDGDAKKTFNITNSGNKDLEVTFTNGTNFTVDKKTKKFITFSNNKKWNDVYLHAWKNGNESLTGGWPGVKQTNMIGTNIYGEDIYLIEIPDGTENIIINNGSGTQTQDLTMDYTKSGLYLGEANGEGKFAGVFYGAGDLLVPINLTAPFTIQMNTATVGVKAAEDIVLAYTASNGTSTTVNVSGYVADDTKFLENFSANALPDGWTNGSNSGASWTFADGVAYGQYSYSIYSNAKMMLPLLTVAEGESLVFQTKGNTSYAEMKVNVYQRDGVTKVKTVDFSTEARAAYTAGEYTMVTLSGLDAGDYKLEFEAYNSYIDNINGFTINPNDPKIAVSKFALPDPVPVTSGTLDDFGWSKTNVEALYFISNSGTGTLTISDISVPDGFTAGTTGNAMTVGAGEEALTLIVTMTSGVVGPLGGTITLTTDGGNFEIPVKGFIYGDKSYIDFTDASKYAGWTTEGWTISDGIAKPTSTSSAATMQTTKFNVDANEKLYVDIKGSTSSVTKSFAYS